MPQGLELMSTKILRERKETKPLWGAEKDETRAETVSTKIKPKGHAEASGRTSFLHRSVK